MRIKITEPGWAGYNGPLGTTLFQDGVSVGNLTKMEADFIGANLRVVEVDDEGNELGQVSLTAEMVRTASIPSPVVEPLVSGVGNDSPDVQDQNGTAPAPEAPLPLDAPSEDAPAKIYTRAELEEIADKDGIKGLRVIGTPLGAKNTSINKLIDEIVEAQDALQKAS